MRLYDLKPVLLGSGNVLNHADGTVDLVSVPLTNRNYGHFALKSKGTLGAGTHLVQIMGLDPGAATYSNPLVVSAAVGTGVAAEVNVGADMQDTATSGVTTRGLQLSGGVKAQLVLAGTSSVNNVNWEFWGFP